MAAASIPPIEFPRTYLAKRLPGRGSIDTRNKGFAWQVMRDGVRYRGPTLATRADAEAGLEEALAALARGEIPAVAPPRAENRPRSRTVSLPQLRRELETTELVAYPAAIRRPRERADCLPCPACQEWRDNGASASAGRLACGHVPAEAVAHSRPCLFVACAASNYLDENPDSGSIKFNHPRLEPGDVAKDSCSLDVADDGPATLDRVGTAIGVTRERCRQVEEIGLYKIRRSGDGGLSMMPDRDEYAAPRGFPGCP